VNDSLKRIGPCLALLVALLPAVAFAQAHGGGGVRPGPASRPAPAPASRPAAGGFNFKRDVAPAPAHENMEPIRSIAPQRGATPERRASQPAPPAALARGNEPGRPAYAPPANYQQAQFRPNHSGGPHGGHFGAHPIRNPRFDGRQYGWNNGVVWRPAPTYWGGGFWGPFALADLSAAVLFGSVLDAENNVYYPSYQVEPDTPGYDILSDYGLQQVECGPPGLVEIWGPDDSVVCAEPNDQAAKGNYEVDPATFTLVPAT
jgi:hypothetical protein